MTKDENAPVACALNPGDYKTRIAWIADLTRDALLSQTRRDLQLELIYSADAAQRVREMVRKEQDCCAFLAFHLDEQPDEIRLTIKVPETARNAADMLFSQFLPSTEARAGCDCS